LPTLTFLELEQLEGDLSLFDHNAQRFTNDWVFPETNAHSFEITSDSHLKD
jgi:hypothetical protein